MNWIISASEWARTALQNSGSSPLALPLAFVMGLASALASTCCALPVFGVVVGYAGTREPSDRRSCLIAAFSFMVGTTLALLVLGSVAGFVGQVAQRILGQYWKIFAGLFAIVFGLGALNLLPFKMPGKAHENPATARRGLLGAVLIGLVMGGAVSVCSLGCNPGIFVIIGVALLKGYTLWMLGVMTAYGIGFSLPLAALMLGVTLGKTAVSFKKADAAIRAVAGVVLIGVGFYLLYSF